jgi:hypothetical protein
LELCQTTGAQLPEKKRRRRVKSGAKSRPNATAQTKQTISSDRGIRIVQIADTDPRRADSGRPTTENNQRSSRARRMRQAARLAMSRKTVSP